MCRKLSKSNSGNFNIFRLTLFTTKIKFDTIKVW
jgi:hypothetical protein